MNEEKMSILAIFGVFLLLFICINYSMYLGSNTYEINCEDIKKQDSIVKFYEQNVVTVSCEDGKLITKISPVTNK